MWGYRMERKHHRIGEKYTIRACIDCGYIGEDPPIECVPSNISLSRRIDIIEREMLIRYILQKMRKIEETLMHCIAVKSPDQRRRELYGLYREVQTINDEYKDKEIIPLSDFHKGVIKNEGERIEKEDSEDKNQGSMPEDENNL